MNNSRIHVAQVVSTYPPYKGGMGNVAFEYTQKLKERGHKVSVFTPDYGGKRSDNPDVHLLKPAFTYGNAAYLPQLPQNLKDVDVIHLHLPFFGGVEWLYALKPPAPMVVSYHMDVQGSGWQKAVFALHRSLFLKKVLTKSEAILISTKDYIEHSFLSGYPNLKPKIHVLPFGVSDDFARHSNEVPFRPFRFLFVGGLDKPHYFKGLSVLIDALAHIAPLNWVLDIVGEGELKPSYQKLVEQNRLQEKVRFRGGISRDELISAYQESHATVLPSIDRSESFGLVLIESMACGTPVIATDLPGVRTVLLPEKTGFLAKPGDAKDLAIQLRRMIDLDESNYRAMRMSANQLVEEQYRWPFIIDRLEELYLGLI